MDLLTRLYNANLFAEKSGLENMREALKLLGNPEKRFRSIHIAGSNGKGSVATKVAKGLRGDIGLFTSPHLFAFNERIQINGEPIPDEDLEHLLETTFDLIDRHQIPCTFFEITTLVAFQYFAKWKVSMAVLETGLGGRFDATNVVTPDLSVITSISLEHTEILGADLQSIANEKAGIIKPNVPVILGPGVPLDPPLAERVEGLFETYLDANTAIAKAVLKRYGVFEVPDVTPPCRMEIHQGIVPVILDVAHNPDGLKQLFQTLKNRMKCERFHIVCGLGAKKDHKACIDQILPHASHITLTEAPNGRCTPAANLRSLIPETTPCEIQPNPAIATQEALERAIRYSEPLLVCGSFFIMEPLAKLIENGFTDNFSSWEGWSSLKTVHSLQERTRCAAENCGKNASNGFASGFNMEKALEYGSQSKQMA